MRKHPAVGMRAEDLGELYTYLRLFGHVYTDYEEEREKLESGIEDIYTKEYRYKDAASVLEAMRNPRQAGRKRKIKDETVEQIHFLKVQGKSIREISAETGIPKSTIQRITKSF